jgi:hypothetical protein
MQQSYASSSDSEIVVRLKRQIARGLRSDGAISPDVISHMTSLGLLRHEEGEYVRAERIFRRALQLMLFVDPLCPKTLANLLTAYGRLLHEMGAMLGEAVASRETSSVC